MCKAPIAQPNAAAVAINFDLIAAIEKAAEAAAQNAALQQQAEEARLRALPKCVECDQPATLYCDECTDDLCDVHSQQLHTRKKFQSHTVVGMTEKAALLAANKKRELKAQANRCALHPDQIKYMFCTDCKEAICTACVLGRHSAHSKIEIGEAAAKERRELEVDLAKISSGKDSSGNAINTTGFSTLEFIDALSAKLNGMKEGSFT